MSWQVVEISSSSKAKGIPSVSIGYGRITVNAAACEMLGDYNKYQFVELLTNPDKPNHIGIRFLTDATGKSIKTKRKTIDGKLISGIEIPSKAHVHQLFGEAGIAKKTTKRSVVKGDEENMLIILPQ